MLVFLEELEITICNAAVIYCRPLGKKPDANRQSEMLLTHQLSRSPKDTPPVSFTALRWRKIKITYLV
jgi:hypothetical protein